MPDDFSKIEHLVVLMMENRSFDHVFGSYSLLEGRTEVNGLTPDTKPLLDKDGTPVPFWDMGKEKLYGGYADPPHGFGPQHANWNGGENDGFVTEFQAAYPSQTDALHSSRIPVGYYGRDTLSVLYALADEFCLCDNWFSSILSSTWPNRKYMYCGHRDKNNDTDNVPKYPGFEIKLLLEALSSTNNKDTGQKLSWLCYYSDLPFLAFWYDFAPYHRGHFKQIDQFVTDCSQGTLPTLSLIDPPFSLCDDHPSHNVMLGEKFIGLVVDALTHSKSWSNTALVILYDENGGFYDHEPPPESYEVQAKLPPDLDDRLGFRVPAVVISPYAKKEVCKTVFDHTSIMRSIATRWGVEFPANIYGTRWPLAPDIWSTCFDFSLNAADRPMKTYTETAADLASGKPTTIQSLNWSSATGTGGGIAEVLEKFIEFPLLKDFDHRAQALDHLASMEQGIQSLKNAVKP